MPRKARMDWSKYSIGERRTAVQPWLICTWAVAADVAITSTKKGTKLSLQLCFCISLRICVCTDALDLEPVLWVHCDGIGILYWVQRREYRSWKWGERGQNKRGSVFLVWNCIFDWNCDGFCVIFFIFFLFCVLFCLVLILLVFFVDFCEGNNEEIEVCLDFVCFCCFLFNYLNTVAVIVRFVICKCYVYLLMV